MAPANRRDPFDQKLFDHIAVGMTREDKEAYRQAVRDDLSDRVLAGLSDEEKREFRRLALKPVAKCTVHELNRYVELREKNDETMVKLL